VVNLSAKEAYSVLTPEKKNTIMEFVLSKLDNALVVVSYGYKRELWRKNAPFNEVALLDSWDLNTLYTQKSSAKTLQKTDVHPWFFYFGANFNIYSKNTDRSTGMLSSRLGFFLLKNVWDLALSYTFGVQGTGINSDLGLMSKVYYPVKKYKISPYVGLGISYNWTLTYVPTYENGYEEYNTIVSNSWNIPVYLGISWYVGPGSLDAGAQISKNTVYTVGYTFALSSLFKK
jgi:hypothetical protein